MFNTFLWSLYSVSRSHDEILGMWSSYDIHTMTKKILILVNDVQPFLNLSWLTNTQDIKTSHLRCLTREEETILQYSIISTNQEHYQIIICQEETVLLQGEQNLHLHLHKQKNSNDTTISRMYHDDDLNKLELDIELERIEEDFYFECFSMARFLKRKDYWKAKLIETTGIKTCFYELQQLDRHTLDKELTIEIKDCIEDFQMTATWERLFYYIHLFEKTKLKDKQEKNMPPLTSELKGYLNMIYKEANQNRF